MSLTVHCLGILSVAKDLNCQPSISAQSNIGFEVVCNYTTRILRYAQDTKKQARRYCNISQ